VVTGLITLTGSKSESYVQMSNSTSAQEIQRSITVSKKKHPTYLFVLHSVVSNHTGKLAVQNKIVDVKGCRFRLFK